MKVLKIKIATYIIEMCNQQIEYYTKVIGSCETREQLVTVMPWICDGFSSLETIAENLPRRWRKLLLPVIAAAKGHVLTVRQKKSSEIFQKILQKELEEVKSVMARPSDMEDAIGSMLKHIAKAFPGAVIGKVVVGRVKSDEEDSAAERPADSPDPVEPGENAGGSDPEE